jgi:hypothetical protein
MKTDYIFALCSFIAFIIFFVNECKKDLKSYDKENLKH